MSTTTSTKTADDKAVASIIVAMHQALSRNIPELRDRFLADQTPEIRDGYWLELADARETLGL
jgi:hypothetical protein